MSKSSTALPSGAAVRGAGAAVLMAAGALVLGSCSLVGGSDAPSKPVRVESREEARTRAERIEDHVRTLTGLERNPWGGMSGFFECPGRGISVADEGEPYQLGSAIQLDAADEQRPEVVRALREKLAGEGFKIASKGSDADTWDFKASQESEHYTITVGAVKPGQGVTVMVTLPCQAPPTGVASPAPTPTT
ncbi:hypothetical protein ACIRST_09880 [Kitasatospora sp. NPDC101447]|uniref:hypothetical protein n=1 Tax=Kitasatospora sp. NPDC101447 TaxID=3364102 RepID=UPI00382A4F43